MTVALRLVEQMRLGGPGSILPRNPESQQTHRQVARRQTPGKKLETGVQQLLRDIRGLRESRRARDCGEIGKSHFQFDRAAFDLVPAKS